MDGLMQIANHLKAMHPDMQRLAGIGDAIAESRVLEYIDGANLEQCKDIVDALVNRVGDLLGDATHLEDAAAQLASEIEAQDAIDNPPLCAACNGSGEGEYDGTTCSVCKGRGTEFKEAA